MTAQVRRGQRFVAADDRRPAERLFITVSRVAKDGSWADVECYTWAVMWRKRAKLVDGRLPFTTEMDWTADDLAAQEKDHMAMLDERSRRNP